MRPMLCAPSPTENTSTREIPGPRAEFGMRPGDKNALQRRSGRKGRGEVDYRCNVFKSVTAYSWDSGSASTHTRGG